MGSKGIVVAIALMHASCAFTSATLLGRNSVTKTKATIDIVTTSITALGCTGLLVASEAPDYYAPTPGDQTSWDTRDDRAYTAFIGQTWRLPVCAIALTSMASVFYARSAIRSNERSVDMRAVAWQAELEARQLALPAHTVRTLASEFPLARAAIADTVATAAHMEAFEAALPTVATNRLGGQLGRYAKRSRTRVALGNVVLEAETLAQLREIELAVANRAQAFDGWGLAEQHAIGRGIVAMFNGPPGAGKTMAANALANSLGLPLYRIDTTSLVDRYVGETEKNLSSLFEEAAASRAALLFDEADALFAKRVEARDATDRSANLQTNLLLNLIEDYDGFVVLTTNLKSALDSAFMRRILFKVTFDLPGLAEREALWRYHVPANVPQAPINFAALAKRFDKISGGDIKNATLRAMLAKPPAQLITEDMLAEAMILERRANGAVIADRRY